HPLGRRRIDSDRMHFASGRSIKTNNKQQAKLTPSDSAIKGGCCAPAGELSAAFHSLSQTGFTGPSRYSAFPCGSRWFSHQPWSEVFAAADRTELPSMSVIDPQNLARALGGEASGNEISCPGPGHSAKDRSLSVKIDPGAPDGFVVHSFADDDSIACK